MTIPGRTSGWWARLLLRLAPPSFRRDYGQEVLGAIVAMLAAESRRAGARASFALRLRAAGDLLRTVAREWVAASRAGLRRSIRDLGGDLRAALRSAARTPVFSVTVIATLTVGVGLASAIFAFADGYLFRPPPFAEPDRLYAVRVIGGRVDMLRASDAAALRGSEIGYLGFVDTVGTPLVPFGGMLRIGARDVRVITSGVPPEYAQFVQAPLALGRPFRGTDQQDVEPIPVWLSHRFWHREFGADPNVIGLRVEHVAGPRARRLEIAGVIDPRITTFSLNFGRNNVLPDLFAPEGPFDPAGEGATVYSTPLVRLPADMTRERAEAAIGAVLGRLTAPRTERLSAVRLVPLQDELAKGGRSAALLLAVGAGLAMALVAVNLAYLLLTRGAARSAEVATRAALGASRWRIARLFLVESGLVGVAGISGGLLLGHSMTTTLAARLPTEGADSGTLALVSMQFDGRVAAFAIAMGALVAFCGGLWPAWRAVRGRLAAPGGSRGAVPARVPLRLSRAIVASQVALSTVVLAGTVFAGIGIWRFLNQPIGFDMDDRFAVRFESAGPHDAAIDWPSLQSAIQRGEGLRAASPELALLEVPVSIGDTALDARAVQAAGVHAQTLEALGSRFVIGRAPDRNEHRSMTSVAVVDDILARLAWPGRSALGERVRVGEREYTVVGVVEHMRWSLVRESPALVYVPSPPVRERHEMIVWAPGLSADRVIERVSAAVRELAPGARLSVRPRSFETVFGDEIANARFQRPLVAVLGAFAVAVSGIGLFGLVGYLVEQRRHDYAVRLALGAQTRDICADLVRQSLVPVCAGLALGLPAARSLSQVANASLLNWESSGVGTLIVVTMTMLAVALLATIEPARRVLRIDPATTLRAE
jgi:predicted permease